MSRPVRHGKGVDVADPSSFSFRSIVRFDERSEWNEIRDKIMDKEVFMAVSEDQALKMFR